jgi:hypothetical protein
MRKQVRVIVALFIGVVESLLVVVVWYVEHLRSWEEAPGYLRIAAPIPVLLGPPDAGPAFWTAWALNSLWWAVFAFGVLSTICSAGRRSEEKSRVA